MVLAIGVIATLALGCAGRRPLKVDALGAPLGLGVCYGPYREGQSPGGAQPSREQLRQDLRLISRDFNTLRTYGTGTARDMLEVAREHAIPIGVFLGAWIAPETRRDDQGNVIEVLHENVAANDAEVATAIELANEFPDLVRAIIVGNETQVFWSGHRVDPEVLIGRLRTVRAGVRVPVTTADDFRFWLEPESDAIAGEVDFIITHAYAMWNGTQLEEAIAFTDEQVRAVRRAHPDRRVVLGETGWATQKHTEGEQATLIKGTPGEGEQSVFLQALREWAAETRTTTFIFEAFDEPWKGGAHPDEVEKHWGLYTVDRRPKRALRDAHRSALLHD
jgi:exo-beta-1,3-glucanase (GH17 family)